MTMPDWYAEPPGAPQPPGTELQVWPVVSVIVGGCGLALAFVPHAVSVAGVVAGAIGLAAGIAGLVGKPTGQHMLLLAVLGAAISGLAIVLGAVMTFVYLRPDGTSTVSTAASPWSNNTAFVLGHQAEVTVGSYDYRVEKYNGVDGGLPVTITNRLDVAVTYLVNIAAIGDGGEQIAVEPAVLTLNAHATGKCLLFDSLLTYDLDAPGFAQRLARATFKIVEARSMAPTGPGQ